jgi:hypothetical protein
MTTHYQPPAQEPGTKADLAAQVADLRARLSECRSRNQSLVEKLLALGVQPGELAWQP